MIVLPIVNVLFNGFGHIEYGLLAHFLRPFQGDWLNRSSAWSRINGDLYPISCTLTYHPLPCQCIHTPMSRESRPRVNFSCWIQWYHFYFTGVDDAATIKRISRSADQLKVFMKSITLFFSEAVLRHISRIEWCARAHFRIWVVAKAH